MYLNVILFKSGATLNVQTSVPFSIDKINDGWNVITDEANGQISSFKGDEISNITSASMDVLDDAKKKIKGKHLTIDE